MGVFQNEGDVDANGAEEVNLRTSTGVELLGQQVSAASLPVVISSNQSAIPVSGTVTANQGTPNSVGNSWPTKITDGTNTLVVNADGVINVAQYPFFLSLTQSYFGVNTETNIVTAGEQDFLLIRNPAGSGKNLHINRVIAGVLGTATRFRVRVYQKPTVTTAGTSLTIFSNTVMTSPTATVMTAYVTPTISARGLRMRTYTSEGTNSVDDTFDFGLDVRPGFDILFTGDFDANNKVLALSIQWGEIV